MVLVVWVDGTNGNVEHLPIDLACIIHCGPIEFLAQVICNRLVRLPVCIGWGEIIGI